MLPKRENVHLLPLEISHMKLKKKKRKYSWLSLADHICKNISISLFIYSYLNNCMNVDVISILIMVNYHIKRSNFKQKIILLLLIIHNLINFFSSSLSFKFSFNKLYFSFFYFSYIYFIIL